MNCQKTIERLPAQASDRAAIKGGSGVVVPFPGRARRPERPVPQADEARGQILLFLGVRYERLAS